MNNDGDDTFLRIGSDERALAPITPRTRFVVWRSLRVVHHFLETDLDEWPDLHGALLLNHFPRFTLSQSEAWWIHTLRSISRMADRMRTGEEWNPRTPAEEAGLYIATWRYFLEAARDEIEEREDLSQQFIQLPDFGGLDFDFDEVLAALAGDTDMATIFDPAADGFESLQERSTEELGLRDYRVSKWHTLFVEYQEEPRFPSSLL